MDRSFLCELIIDQQIKGLKLDILRSLYKIIIIHRPRHIYLLIVLYGSIKAYSRLDKGLDEAIEKRWTVIDMKNDWKVIYPFKLENK